MDIKQLIHLNDLATTAAHRAGHKLVTFFNQLDSTSIDNKSSQVDLVSIADRTAEKLIFDFLKSEIPDYGFIGEEATQGNADLGEFNWVVDPLDGTSNYLCGLPIWSVSIALCDSNLQPVVGTVHAPLFGKTWTAMIGLGARANGSPVSVRKEPPGGGMANAMIATGFPYDTCSGGLNTNLENFQAMQSRFHKIRRMGSAAIDLAMIAEGTFDGMWELKLSAWDTAAGLLLVREAGGLDCRFDGTGYTPGDVDLLVAATPELRDEMRHLISPLV